MSDLAVQPVELSTEAGELVHMGCWGADPPISFCGSPPDGAPPEVEATCVVCLDLDSVDYCPRFGSCGGRCAR